MEHIINHINKYKLEERYNTCIKLSGIRSLHIFVQSDHFSFRMKRIINDNIYSEVKLDDVDMGISPKINI